MMHICDCGQYYLGSQSHQYGGILLEKRRVVTGRRDVQSPWPLMVTVCFTFYVIKCLVRLNTAQAATVLDAMAPLLQANQVTQQLLASGPSGNQVNIGDNQSQDFFAPTGDAKIYTDADGNWSQIWLTPALAYKKGAVTLNTRIDMTQDFSFNWQVLMKASVDSPSATMADGIGFALHPTYTANELGPNQTFAQALNSIGSAGGNLGTADLMNAFGFKLDSYWNWGNDAQTVGRTGSISGSFYKDPRHDNAANGDAYATWDNRIDGQVDNRIPQNNTTQWGPYGMLTKTDGTGYLTNTASDTGAAVSETPLNGAAATSVNLLSGNWAGLNIVYNAAQHQLAVTLTDLHDTRRTMTWRRTLTAPEIALINQKRYYAFMIQGSTGARYAEQSVQRLRGYFTPENPTLLVRKVTTNGMSVADTQTFTQTTVKKTTAPVQITSAVDNNNFQGVLSHILFTTYDANGNPVTKRVNIATNKDGFDRTIDQWSYTVDPTKYTSLTIVTYVYRRTTNIPTMTLSYAGAAGNGTYALPPNGDVNVTASITNPATGPATWMGVYALDQLPSSLQLKTGSNPNVSQAGNQLKINFGAIDRGQTVTTAFTLHYSGTLPATLYPTGVSADSNGMSLGHSAYIYDQSPELIDAAGKRVDGSYYYVPGTLDAPLAAEKLKESPIITDYINLDPGNFVPHIGNAQPAAKALFHYWDITSPGATTMDPILTGHPTQEITGTTGGTLTGLLADPIANAPQPTVLADYTYLGYYEFTGSGTTSTWHDAKGAAAPTFYYQANATSATPQQIAYIYRPSTQKYLAITPPNINFGKRPATAASQGNLWLPSQVGVQAVVTDTRPHTGIPASTGGWQVSITATGPMRGVSSHATLVGAKITFATAGADISTGFTGRAATLALVNGDTHILAQSSVYGSRKLNWGSLGVQLNVPQQAITPDTYQTTITWSVTDGL